MKEYVRRALQDLSNEYRGEEYPIHYKFFPEAEDVELVEEWDIVGRTLPIKIEGHVSRGNHAFDENYLVWSQGSVIEMSFEKWKEGRRE